MLRLLLQISPLLTRAGLISWDDKIHGISTVLGTYPIDDDPMEAINHASLDLEAELPRHYALRLDGDDVVIMQRFVDENGHELLIEMHSNELEDDDVDVLMSIISAQGGMFKRYGTFRFDLNLHRQRLLNCAHCGEIWKSSKQSPLRCPRCRNDLPVKSSRRYENVKPVEFDTPSLRRERDHGFNQIHTIEKMRNHPKDTKVRILDCSIDYPEMSIHTLSSALTLIAEEYDAEHLNLVRMPELNKGIIDLLKDVEASIRNILLMAGHLFIWTESVRPIGNWPHTAWISFGLMTEELEHRKSPMLSCMLLLDISSTRWALCILPNVKELKSIYGQGWLYGFNLIRKELRDRIFSVINDPIQIEGQPDIYSMPNSPGARMLSASIAHLIIEPEKDGPETIEKIIVQMFEAYQELLGWWRFPDIVNIKMSM